MFDKFGEFDSYEEINRAAQAQKDEGDEEALYILAEENGIDKEDVEDFLDDCIPELTTALMAAVGKIDVEKESLKLEGILADWADEVKEMAQDDYDLQRAIRKKGNTLAGYIALTAETGLTNAATVPEEVVKLTKKVKQIVGNHPFKIGIPSKAERKMLIRKHYVGGKK